MPSGPIADLARVIQLSIAPVFLITGIASLLGVLSARLARLVDRARILEALVQNAGDEKPSRFLDELHILSRRSKLIYRAITLSTTSALLVCFVITSLFVSALGELPINKVVGALFIGAMLALIAALLLFLREIFLATRALRIGAHLVLVLMIAATAHAQTRPRARDLGVDFDGTTGPNNAITDIAGVEVGMVTIIRDEPKAVRTGVTAILPRGKSGVPVFGAWFPLNGNGEMTGTHWLDESGFLEGPILITNTHSVGVVRDAVVRWQVEHHFLYQDYTYPVVAETFDGYLNDINGFHVTAADAMRALDSAKSGAVAEGNVGGGTGMICYEFKCGTGTASRRVSTAGHEYTVGVLVQANHGARYQLLVRGVPVGRALKADAPFTNGADLDNERGSIIIVVATDAPLLPHQLRRLAKRAALGLARTGGRAGNGSGDIFMAFSTANAEAPQQRQSLSTAAFVPNDRINPIFNAVILATEEAILNALVAGETMTGVDGHRAVAIPKDELRALLRRR